MYLLELVKKRGVALNSDGKKIVPQFIVNQMKLSDPPRRFLAKAESQTGGWYDVPDKSAYKMVLQLIMSLEKQEAPIARESTRITLSARNECISNEILTPQDTDIISTYRSRKPNYGTAVFRLLVCRFQRQFRQITSHSEKAKLAKQIAYAFSLHDPPFQFLQERNGRFLQMTRNEVISKIKAGLNKIRLEVTFDRGTTEMAEKLQSLVKTTLADNLRDEETGNQLESKLSSSNAVDIAAFSSEETRMSTSSENDNVTKATPPAETLTSVIQIEHQEREPAHNSADLSQSLSADETNAGVSNRVTSSARNESNLNEITAVLETDVIPSSASRKPNRGTAVFGFLFDASKIISSSLQANQRRS